MPGRIMIVEDEPHIVESLTFLLTREGYEVEAIADGDAALAALAARLPRLLVLDAMLPGSDGFAILRRLRAEPRSAGLPILMLTAKGQRRDREVAEALGADRFLAKPFSNAELIETVRELAPMTPPDPPPPELRPGDPFHGHRARDAGLVLPLAGLVLVAPPAVNLFTADVTVLGAPLIAVYLFAVWALLILCAQRLSRRLDEADRP